MERGALGVWLVGEAGAVLRRERRQAAFTASASRTTDRDLPPSDRIAHLLLALRTDEEGFATVANHAFSRRALARAPAHPQGAAPGAGRRGEGGCASTMAWNVVIAGGGFGGLYAARRLERVLPRHSARITLVTDTNFLLYTPLLPGAAAGRWSRGTSWSRCARSSTGPTSGSAA